MMLSALTYTLYMSQVRIIISTKGKMSFLVVFFTFAQCTHRSLPYSCCTWTTIPSMWLPPYLALVDPSSGRRREPFWQTTQSQRQLPGTWLYHDNKFHTPNLILYQKLCNLLGNVNVLPPDRQPPVLRYVPRRGVHHVGNEEHPRSDPYHCLRTWHRPHVWSQTPSQPKPRWGPSSYVLHESLDPDAQAVNPTAAKEEVPSVVESLKSSMALFRTPDMMAFSFTLFYTGLHLTLWDGLFSTCIGFTGGWVDLSWWRCLNRIMRLTGI